MGETLRLCCVKQAWSFNVSVDKVQCKVRPRNRQATLSFVLFHFESGSSEFNL